MYQVYFHKTSKQYKILKLNLTSHRITSACQTTQNITSATGQLARTGEFAHLLTPHMFRYDKKLSKNSK